VARNLEPYRGFPSFMRSLPAILEQRPNARVLIVGGDEISYGHRLPEGQTHKQHMLAELGSSLDLSRVHFPGQGALPGFPEDIAGFQGACVPDFSVCVVLVDDGGDVCRLPCGWIEDRTC